MTPVTAHVLEATPGRDGINPLSTIKLQAASRRVKKVTLGPGATITFEVRVMLGAFHVPRGVLFKPLVNARMRELQIGTDTTAALFACVADHPQLIALPTPGNTGVGLSTLISRTRVHAAVNAANLVSPTPAPDPAQAVVGPQDRQYWAHLLNLYNRSLRAYKRTGDEPLRTGRF
jgi:hypothetical protein